MYHFLEADTFRDLESIIRDSIRTQSLWDEAHEEEQVALADELDVVRTELEDLPREQH